MPACCGAPVVHTPLPNAAAAVSGFTLALAFHVGCAASSAGSADSSSAAVHGAFRAAVAARILATSAGVTTDPVLPKLLRTNDAIAEIHSSLFVPIGIITSVYVLPSIGPVNPWIT